MDQQSAKLPVSNFFGNTNQAPVPRRSAIAAVADHPVLCILALVCLVYGNSLLNGFTVDDPVILSDNGFVSQAANIRHLFDRQYFQYSNEASYRPLCTLTYFFDAAVWPRSTAGAHFTNLLLFLAVSLLFMATCRTVDLSPPAALLATVLFVIHPVHTEVVNSISYREDLLAPFFILLSWILYVRGLKNHAVTYRLAGLLAFFFGTLSKESAIVFPALFALLEWMRTGSLRRLFSKQALLFLFGTVLITCLFMVVRFSWMPSPPGSSVASIADTAGTFFLTNVKVHAYYLRLLIQPYPLLAAYSKSFYTPTMDPRCFVSLGSFILAALLVIRFRRSPFLVAGLLWWFISLVPVSQVYPLFNPMAERYLFLASMGPCLWAGGALVRAATPASLRRFRILTLILMLLLAGMTIRRNTVWHDELTLWTATVRDAPPTVPALHNLAAAQFTRGDFGGAIHTARRALALVGTGGNSRDAGPLHLVIGSALYGLGRHTAAMDALESAACSIPLRPDIDAAIYYNIGLIHDARGELPDALASFTKAAEIEPFRGEIWRKITFCYLALGLETEAEPAWGCAMALDPSLPPFADINRAFQQQ